MRIADLVQSAGGLLRSANPDAGDLTHYVIPSNSVREPRAVWTPGSESGCGRLQEKKIRIYRSTTAMC